MGNAGQTNYAAAKAGVVGFTKALAREIGSRGITVNAVAPGYIETSMTATLTDEQRRRRSSARSSSDGSAPADDVAGAVLYLASDAAAYVTGTCPQRERRACHVTSGRGASSSLEFGGTPVRESDGFPPDRKEEFECRTRLKKRSRASSWSSSVSRPKR